MGDDLVLYRTFIPFGRFDRLRLNRPDRLVDNRPVDLQDYVIR
jgi:hypothetical protein